MLYIYFPTIQTSSNLEREVRTLDLVSGSPIGCADELRLDYLVLGEHELVYVAGEASGIIA